MKKLLVIMLMASTAVFSATTTNVSNQSNFDIRVPVKNWIKKMNDGFRFGIGKGSLNVNARIRKNTGQNFKVDESANDINSTNFQLHIGHERIRTQEIGYSTFLIYQDIESDDENVRNIRLSGNGTYGLTKQAFVYGGLNYGKWYGSGEIEDTYEAGIGYQAGIGLILHKKATLEVEYLTLLNEGSDNGFNIDLEAKGVMMKINTPFSFDI